MASYALYSEFRACRAELIRGTLHLHPALASLGRDHVPLCHTAVSQQLRTVGLRRTGPSAEDQNARTRVVALSQLRRQVDRFDAMSWREFIVPSRTPAISVHSRASTSSPRTEARCQRTASCATRYQSGSKSSWDPKILYSCVLVCYLYICELQSPQMLIGDFWHVSLALHIFGPALIVRKKSPALFAALVASFSKPMSLPVRIVSCTAPSSICNST